MLARCAAARSGKKESLHLHPKEPKPNTKAWPVFGLGSFLPFGVRLWTISSAALCPQNRLYGLLTRSILNIEILFPPIINDKQNSPE